MTTRELKEKLKDMPDNLSVIAIIGSDGLDGDVTDVTMEDGIVMVKVII